MFRIPSRPVPTFPATHVTPTGLIEPPPWPEPIPWPTPPRRSVPRGRCRRYRAVDHAAPTMEEEMRANSPRQRAIRKALAALLPHAPYADHAAIYDAAKRRRMRDLAPPAAAFLAAVAHIRHVHSDYDDLLDEGYDPESARHFVLDDTNDVLTRWGATRLVDGSEEMPEADETDDVADGAIADDAVADDEGQPS